MKKGFTALFLIILLSPLAFPHPGYCLSHEGVTSTQFFWYNDFFDETHFDGNQLLKLQLNEINRNPKLRIDLYGKVWTDFSEGEGSHGRLYDAFLEVKDIFKHTDIRLGRQFVYMTAGSSTIDGLRVDYRLPGIFGISLAGGRDVLFSETGEFTREGDYAWGLNAYLLKYSGTSLSLSYYQKYDEHDLAREIVGVNFSQNIRDNLNFYLESSFDITSELFNLVQTGFHFDPVENLFLTAEYYLTNPNFDSTSIYSVFAANNFQRILARGQYRISPKASLEFELAHQEYGDGGDGNEAVISCNCTPFEGTSFLGKLIFRDGDGGDVVGFEVSGSHSFTDALSAAAGIQYDSYERDYMTTSEDAQRYWIGGSYVVSEQVKVSLRIEDSENKNFNHDLRSRVSFNLAF